MADDILHSELTIAQVNDIEIAFDTFGADSGEPLLLIMGLGSQLVAWDEEFCRQMAARGYRVIRFDNRDIGLSTKFNESGAPDIAALEKVLQRGEAPRLPYTLLDMAKDAAGLVKALGYDSAHIVGESMGGMIGQLMAIHLPECIRTFTSLMSSTGDPALPPPDPAAMEILHEPFPTDRKGYIKDFVRAYKVLNGPVIPISERLTRKWAEQSYDRGLNPDGITRQYAAMIASGDRTALLRTVSVPTLVIHGDTDPILPVKCGIATANAIPGAQLNIVEGMGHALPEAVWSRMIEAIVAHAI